MGSSILYTRAESGRVFLLLLSVAIKIVIAWDALGIGQAVYTELEPSIIPGRWPGMFYCRTGYVTDRQVEKGDTHLNKCVFSGYKHTPSPEWILSSYESYLANIRIISALS